jgi:CRP/FNR family transcriptional regulator, cyclic AMP receptor protein
MLAPIRFQSTKSNLAVRMQATAATSLRPVLDTMAMPKPRWNLGFERHPFSPAHPHRDFAAEPNPQSAPQTHPGEIDPLYLLACRAEWERWSEPSSAWELIAAAQSPHDDTRAHARALLATSRLVDAGRVAAARDPLFRPRRHATVEANMKTPYGLEIIENCSECHCRKPGFFCSFSPGIVKSLDHASHHSTMPAGAILFVEGQVSRGVFILCSGRVKLSTASREGKVLILKTVEAGEVIGLSAAISGASYEMTAETAIPCQLNFISRKDLLEMLHGHSEVGVHATESLSADFQSAYRDIRDLVMARSSEGKLARLLLSCSPGQTEPEFHLRAVMTHEEMAQRIGSSRETVTRLLTELKRKQMIRLDGATLVIRNRNALEALAV